ASYQEGKLTDNDRKAIRSALAAQPQVVPLLEQAAGCPDFNAQHDYSAGTATVMNKRMADVHDFRGVAQFLKARAHLLAAEGDLTGALHSCVLLFRLTRLYE